MKALAKIVRASMTVRKTVAIVISICFFYLTPVLAEDQEVSKTPLEKCDFLSVTSMTEFASAKKEGEIAAEALKPLQEFEALNHKGDKWPNDPLIDHLTKDEAGQASELTQQMRIQSGLQEIESQHQKALEFFSEMFSDVTDEYKSGKIPAYDTQNEAAESNQVYAVVITLRQTIPAKSNPDSPEHKICSMDYALWKEELAPATVIERDSDGIQAANAIFQDIKKKYGEDVNFSSLNKADAEKFQQAKSSIGWALKSSQYVHDLDNLRLMIHAEDIYYNAYKDDITLSGGRIDSLGDHLRKIAIAPDTSDDMKKAINAIVAIHQLVPSDNVKMQQQMNALAQH